MKLLHRLHTRLLATMLVFTFISIHTTNYNAFAKSTYSIKQQKLYKNNMLFTGIYKQKKYVKGVVDQSSLYVFHKTLYKNGHVYKKTVVYKNVLYMNGVKATGKVVYNKKLYVNGKLAKGYVLSNEKHLYKNGSLVKGFDVFKDVLYYNGSKYKEMTVHKNILYTKSIRATGIILFNNKLYVDGVLKAGYFLYNPTDDPQNFEAETLYYNGAIKKETVMYEGITYVNGKIKLP